MKKIKIGILAVAMFQMIPMITSSGLSEVAKAFPEASTMLLQFTQTISGISGMIIALLAGKIYDAIGRKRCVIIGFVLLEAVTVVAYFYHPSISVVCLYSLLQGIGTALFIPAVGSAIIDLFSGEERAKMVGNQNSFVSIGGIVLAFFGGLLASFGWYYSYLGYLFTVPALFAVIFCFPADVKKDTKKEKVNASREEVMVIIKYTAFAVLISIVTGAINSNLSLFVAEQSFGSTVLTGSINSMSMMVGVISGYCFGHYLCKIEDRLFLAISIMAFVVFAILSLTNNVYVTVACVLANQFLSGMMLPRALLSISENVDSSLATFTSGLTCSVIPNISGLLSSVIITGIADRLYVTSTCHDRFRVASFGALLLSVFFMLYLMKKKRGHK